MEKRTLTLDEVEATQASLSAAISAALGTPVNARFYREDSRGKERLYVISTPLPLTGPAYFMFKKLRVGSFGSISIVTDQTGTDDEPFAWFDLHFDYEYQTSGGNGCGAGVMGKRITMKLVDLYAFGAHDLTWKAGIL